MDFHPAASPTHPSPGQEAELSRLSALLRYEILDTPHEDAFDDFTALAAQICGTPIALISLIDEQRQWFKSRVGLDADSTPRQVSFCAHAIQGTGIFEIDDARQDPRFADNPLVTGEPNIRFYAGTPLTTPDGHKLGTLCVIDRQPRRLTDAQREALGRLGRQVIRLFEQRLLTRQYAEQAALQQAILDHAASAVLVMRSDGRIAQVNPAAERLFGHAEQALLGRSLTSALFPPDALRARAAQLSCEPGFEVLAEQVRLGLVEPRPWRLLHRDGSEVPVRLSVSAIPGEQAEVRGYLAIAYDMSDQEQLQLRLQQIAAQVPGMLFQFRSRAGERGVFTYVSEGIAPIYGLSPEQVAGMHPLLERVHADDRSWVLERIRQAAFGQTAWHIEHRVQHPQRGLLWVDARATPLPQADGSVLWHGLLTDISVHKAQQAELEKQQEMNRRMIETLSEGIIACDASGHLNLFNHKARQWFGETPPEPADLLDRFSIFDSNGGMPLPFERMPLTRALKGESVVDAELTVLSGDVARHLLTSAHPLYASDGRHLGAVAVMHDITERRRTEGLQREFVATVSHELRTPLTSITGSLALICGAVMGEVPEHLRELLEIAHQNSLRLSALINDLLDLDKLNAGKMRFDLRPQPLQPLLEQALRGNQGYADRYAVGFRLLHACQARVRVDALRLHQVLSNLLSNAVKFSPPGSVVELTAVRVERHVRVTICDKGPGVTEAFRERVFQKFAQADASDTRQKSGTGLGLAISKELIEHMNGRIGFDSVPGQGACFWFELPLVRKGEA